MNSFIDNPAVVAQSIGCLTRDRKVACSKPVEGNVIIWGLADSAVKWVPGRTRLIMCMINRCA